MKYIYFSITERELENQQELVKHHNRLKRSVLSSIFVQMPEDEEGAEKAEELIVDDDFRDKKSKGSTTVCLEIKSDPTKPPSTICGPEIKPNSPFDPHNMYSLGQNDVSNGYYYTEPQADKTVWSLNALHDPVYYPSLNYKDQSTNREDQRHNSHKHNVNNGDRSDNLKSTSHVTSLDKRYQKENSMSQNNMLSVEDKSKTLETMPVAANYMQQDNARKMERGQISKSMLSENNDVQTKNIPEISRNNFKDLDFNLDGEMSSSANSYLDPNTFTYNQYDPNLNGHTFGNELNSAQTVFYPFTNYDSNGGNFKAAAEQNDGLCERGQSQISNEPLVGLHLGGELKQPFEEEHNSGVISKSAGLMNEQTSNMESSEGLNQEAVGNSDPSMIAAATVPRGAYEYNSDYPNREYTYKPTTYPYVPPRRYPFRPNYENDPYDPDCRSGRCRSAATTSLDSFPIFPWHPIGSVQRNSGILGVDAFTPILSEARSESIFESIPNGVDEQFRGNAYYSGRPYPYRPPYEYQNTHSYPYSSQPYPYRPSSYSYPSGYTYPYDPNCRTADGRSCRDAEAERSAESSDVDVSPSVRMQSYIDSNGPQNPLALEFQARSTMDSSGLQNTAPSENEVLGSTPPKFRTQVPAVEPQIMPAHVPVGLACNVVHAPVLPAVHAPLFPTRPVLPLTPEISAGHGHIHHVGGKKSNIRMQIM